MTIVVVREEPAGDSDAAASVLAAASAFAVDAGFGASAVAGARTAVEGALVDAAAAGAVAASAGFGAAAGPAVDCEEKAEDETRRARRRAGIAESRFMAGETIGRTGTRQAAMERA